MDMATGAVKSKVRKQKVKFSTFNIRQGTVVHRIDTLYTILLETVYLLHFKSVRCSWPCTCIQLWCVHITLGVCTLDWLSIFISCVLRSLDNIVFYVSILKKVLVISTICHFISRNPYPVLCWEKQLWISTTLFLKKTTDGVLDFCFKWVKHILKPCL